MKFSAVVKNAESCLKPGGDSKTIDSMDILRRLLEHTKKLEAALNDIRDMSDMTFRPLGDEVMSIRRIHNRSGLLYES